MMGISFFFINILHLVFQHLNFPEEIQPFVKHISKQIISLLFISWFVDIIFLQWILLISYFFNILEGGLGHYFKFSL